MSEEKKELFAAMVKAQAAMGSAKKDSDNPFFKSKYADLGSVIAATKDALHDAGLAIMQFPLVNENGVGVTTMLVHESGQSISNDLVLPLSKHDAQGYGSAITYARRYGWQAMCGIPSEDDDGNSACEEGKGKPQKAAEHRADPLQDQSMSLFDSVKNDLTPEFRQWCMDAFNPKYRNYQGVIDAINQWKGENQ